MGIGSASIAASIVGAKIEASSNIEKVEVKQLSKSNETRTKILEFEDAMLQLPGAHRGDWDKCPLTHTFADGIYVREIFMPAGMLIVSKIHKFEHPYFVLSGDVSVFTEEGAVRIKAPFSGITPAGTKRILYIHEDTTWITVHATKETNLEKIEEEIIAKTYNELPSKENLKLETKDVTDIKLKR